MNTNLAYRDEFQWEERLNGKAIAMSPRPSVNHNRISRNITNLFSNYLDEKPCEPFGDGVHGAPDLVAEILSPGTAKNDRGYKQEVYEKAGVKEYWIINPTDKSIEQYFLEEERFVLHDVYSIRPEWELERMTKEERAALPTAFKYSLYDDLLISLEDIFSRVH